MLFQRVTSSVERDQVKLVESSLWLKVDPCPPDCDKKYLAHAVGSTFGGILRSEIQGEYCRLLICVDVRRPLRRGIFASVDSRDKV